MGFCYVGVRGFGFFVGLFWFGLASEIWVFFGCGGVVGFSLTCLFVDADAGGLWSLVLCL